MLMLYPSLEIGDRLLHLLDSLSVAMVLEIEEGPNLSLEKFCL